MPILKTVDMEDSEFVFIPNSENGRFCKFRSPAEPSAPTGGRFTEFVFVFFNCFLRFRQDESETCCFEELCL